MLTFHVQTRLNPTDRNETDVLPRGTVLRVRMLNGVDSNVDRDGSEFRGEVVESVSEGSRVIVHSESEVRWNAGIASAARIIRSGFRYELLVTRLTDHTKTYDLTASLNPSFFDAGEPAHPISKAEAQRDSRTNEAGTYSLQSPLPNGTGSFCAYSVRNGICRRYSAKKYERASFTSSR